MQTETEPESPRLGRRRLTILVGGFVATRALAYLLGVRFNAGIDAEWQLLDPDLLRHDFVQSLWNLHAQPPLFNAFVGVVVHLPHSLEQPAFAVTYLALGVLLMLSLAALMVELGVSARVATVVTFVFIAGPAALLYENWLFYTYPVAALLAFAALAFLRWQRTTRRVWGASFFASLAVVALTRSTYHLIWFLLVVGLVLLSRRMPWREVAALAFVPLALVAGLYVKNYVLFGTPSASSWQGMTLAYITTLRMPDDERHRMEADGRLTPFSLIAPFAYPGNYAPLLPAEAPSGVPALDQQIKPGGIVNYNNHLFIAVDRKYLHDALAVARADPAVVLDGIAYSAKVLFVPSSDYFAVRQNQDKLGGWYTGYVTVVEGRLGTHVAGGNWGELLGYAPKAWYLPASRIGITILGVYLIALAGAVYALAGLVRRRFRASPSELTVCFMSLTMGWALLAAILVGSGETNRFRFELDPIAIALAAWTLHQLLTRRRQSTRRIQRLQGGMPVGQPISR